MKIVAKGKKKLQAEAEDQEAIDKFEKESLKPHKAAPSGSSEINTKEVLNVLADEIEQIYTLEGVKIDRLNSMEKARTLYLEIRYKLGAKVKEHEYDLPLCKEHRQ